MRIPLSSLGSIICKSSHLVIFTANTIKMADEPRSIRAVYDDAEQKRAILENSPYNSPAFQDSLLAALTLFEQCLSIADRISLFSTNESLEDIASADLQFLALHYRIADLCMRINGQNRKETLHAAQRHYEQYLKLLDSYDILEKSDANMLEAYRESPDTFSTAQTKDPATKRDIKIRRFKEEKSLKQKLEYLRKNPSVLANDDDTYRELQLTNLAYCTHQTFASLESIGQELHILSLAPPGPPPDYSQPRPEDARDRDRKSDGFSERLDSQHLSAGMKGPLLDSSGKPLRPFTLLGSRRQEVSEGVFRPDHSLPTMSIDEYLDEERKRGGIIEGGGEKSGIKPQVDEDDYEISDKATMKAREWDEYVEANPKGSGNTINRG
jgi:immunoglobulin-binding protein 1